MSLYKDAREEIMKKVLKNGDFAPKINCRSPDTFWPRDRPGWKARALPFALPVAVGLLSAAAQTYASCAHGGGASSSTHTGGEGGCEVVEAALAAAAMVVALPLAALLITLYY